METIPPPQPAAGRHISPLGHKPSQELRAPVSTTLPMAELAKALIRQQWPLRHHADPMRRAQAVSLIRTHVHLLRKWESATPMAR